MVKLRIGRLSAAIGTLVALLLLPVAALASGAISQSYTTKDTGIAPGTIISLVSGGVVQAASSGQSGSLVGIAASKPVLELSTSGHNGLQVAVGGTADTLVSDINGAVQAGDKITASPLGGIGMKAVGPGEVVGTAQEGLSSVTTVSRTVPDKTGVSTTVKVGLIPVAINVAYYSATSAGYLSAFIPTFLQNLANAISGRAVSPLRVIMGLLIVVLASVTVIIMLNAAIRSGIVSIGRNPLAEKALRKGLTDVILAALGILLIAAVVVYAILTK